MSAQARRRRREPFRSVVGTYRQGGLWCEVWNYQGEGGCWLLVERRCATPGLHREEEVLRVYRPDEQGRCLVAAEGLVLSRAGSLRQGAEQLAGARVPVEMAGGMFTELGVRRWLHVPAGRLAD